MILGRKTQWVSFNVHYIQRTIFPNLWAIHNITFRIEICSLCCIQFHTIYLQLWIENAIFTGNHTIRVCLVDLMAGGLETVDRNLPFVFSLTAQEAITIISVFSFIKGLENLFIVGASRQTKDIPFPSSFF